LPWIKKIVQDLTKKYKTNNPYELAAFKNVQVILWDMHEEIKGFYKYDKRNKYIFINNNLDESFQRFVCAHELGHSQLHPRVNTTFLRANTLLSTDKIEREANRFAIELLIPDEILYDFQDSILTINEVVATYGIPEEVVHLKKF
jgi:Zn-dependent peptidase ImmA (M78 family)